ncbi:MAG: purine-binding chemotaxis protein CheW [Acidobacteria bacterium]|nr:purine-binding chemotaxis protein CheW [Acidobacteriota bacterium]
MTMDDDQLKQPAPGPRNGNPDAPEGLLDELLAAEPSPADPAQDLLLELMSGEPPAPGTPIDPDELLGELLAAVRVSESGPSAPVEPGSPESSLESVVAAIDQTMHEAPAPQAASQDNRAGRTLQGGLHVLFQLDGSRYAIPVAGIVEAGRVPPITWVPNLPEFVLGVANLRGEVMAVVSLAALLGVTPAEDSDQGRILVIGNGARQCALLVDELSGMGRIGEGQAALGPQPGAGGELLAGVCELDGRLVRLLDVDRLFAAPQLETLAAG